MAELLTGSHTTKFLFCSFLEVKPFRNLLDVGDVWKMDDSERVQLVYVLQSKYYSQASSEFLDVSRAYVQVKTQQPTAIKICLHVDHRITQYIVADSVRLCNMQSSQ